MRRIARWLVFPLLLASALAGFELLCALGGAPELAALVASAWSTLVVVLAERLLPYRAVWSRSHDDVRTDVLHYIFSGGLAELGRTALFAGCAWLALRIAGWTGGALWPEGWPLAVQLALAVLLSELGAYAFHRLCHTHWLFWRLHAMHHTVPRLYWLNSARLHPADTLLTIVLALCPLVALGAGPHVLSLYLVLVYAHGILQHSNVDVRLGPLNWVFAGAELHRWHHSTVRGEQQSNYGGILIVWDLLFGTRHLPPEEPPVEVGLGSCPEFPRGFLGQLASPWRGELFAEEPVSAAQDP